MSTVVKSDNGALSVVQDTTGIKAQYVMGILNSLSQPLVNNTSAYDVAATNSYVTAANPLSGDQQSSLLGLEVVNSSPAQLDATAQKLADETGSNKIDWLAMLGGLWNTVKTSNIPGVSGKIKDIEGEATKVVGSVVADSASQKLASFIRNNLVFILGGSVALVLFVVYSFGKRR